LKASGVSGVFVKLFIAEVATLAGVAMLAACAIVKQSVNSCLRKAKLIQLNVFLAQLVQQQSANTNKVKSAGLSHTHI